jgi:hypothetical protein
MLLLPADSCQDAPAGGSWQPSDERATKHGSTHAKLVKLCNLSSRSAEAIRCLQKKMYHHAAHNGTNIAALLALQKDVHQG